MRPRLTCQAKYRKRVSLLSFISRAWSWKAVSFLVAVCLAIFMGCHSYENNTKTLAQKLRTILSLRQIISRHFRRFIVLPMLGYLHTGFLASVFCCSGRPQVSFWQGSLRFMEMENNTKGIISLPDNPNHVSSLADPLHA